MSCESRVDYVDGVSDHTPRAAIKHAQQRLRKLIRQHKMRHTQTLCTSVSRFYDFWGAVIWVRYEHDDVVPSPATQRPYTGGA
jgi:hypothetical protein